MKLKNITGLLLLGSSLGLGSCSDDGPSKSGVSFEVASHSQLESNATLDSFHPLLIQDAVGQEVEVKILFDRPLEQNAVIAYSVGGTAIQNSTADPVGDFDIVGNGENITVKKGSNEAVIVINLYEDFEFEDTDDDADGYFETIEITLESVVSGPVKISEQATYVMKVYEDDMTIQLDWNAGSGTAGDVDMDLILWLDGEYLGASDQLGTAFEGIAIPAGFPAGSYGVSYNYYSGTSNNLQFRSRLTNLGGTLNSTSQQLTFNGNYTLANINKYTDESSPDPQIIQTMNKSGFNYTNISDIVEPVTGSRIKPSISPEQLQSLKNRIKTFGSAGNSKHQ